MDDAQETREAHHGGSLTADGSTESPGGAWRRPGGLPPTRID